MRTVREFRPPELDDVTTPYLTKLNLLPEKEKTFRDISFDELGRLSIDGTQVEIMNAISSRHGKLLHFFEQNPSQLIELEELNKLLGRGLYTQSVDDIKKDLRKLGYTIRYYKLRNGGYTYYGVTLK